MNRARASVPPDAIRIEDEVWQEAFRETTRPRARPRLRSLDGGRVDDPGRVATRPVAARPVGARPVGARPVAARAVATPPVGVRRASGPVPRQAVADPRPVSSAVPVGEFGDRPVPSPEPMARRTVTITGRGAERNLPWPTESSRRRERRAHERVGFRPDRVAMWAVFLGMLLVLVAALSAHA